MKMTPNISLFLKDTRISFYANRSIIINVWYNQIPKKVSIISINLCKYMKNTSTLMLLQRFLLKKRILSNKMFFHKIIKLDDTQDNHQKISLLYKQLFLL